MSNNNRNMPTYGHVMSGQQYNFYNQKASSGTSGDELEAFRQYDEGINQINEPARPNTASRGGPTGGSFADRA